MKAAVSGPGSPGGSCRITDRNSALLKGGLRVLGEGVGTRKASSSFLVPVVFQETAGQWGLFFAKRSFREDRGPQRGFLSLRAARQALLAVAHKLLRRMVGRLREYYATQLDQGVA